ELRHAERAWKEDIQRLHETEEQLKRLQDEVLTAVDRFDPNFDSNAVEKFKLLNNAVGKLSKAKGLTKFVLLNPLREWDASLLWKDSFAPSLLKESIPDGQMKLLFRQAIWKFLAERLFDRAQPFASYGGEVGKLATSLEFVRLFPDHETNEHAGKWRSVTIRQLSACPESEQDQKEFRLGLVKEFAAWFHRWLVPSEKFTVEEIERAATEKGDLNKRLEDTLSQAIGLSRLLMGERAAFSLVSPPLRDMAFKKEEDDSLTTALGHTVGVVDGADIETDVAGNVRLVGSPMLIKYGNAGGQNLEQETVVVRAFVVM
ncbi:hypothetical protein B0H66DRAFT_462958, partial [Apodospora peruviana]